AELVGDARLRKSLQSLLKQVGDLERLAGRAVLRRMTPREAGGLRDGLGVVPQLLELLRETQAEVLAGHGSADALPELFADLERTLVVEPAGVLGGGPVIADGVSEELDRVRSLARDGKGHLARLEAREREATGISSLKVRFNKVFGYFIEITKANAASAPDRYERKQTLTNAERFITEELKELETQILEAEERLGGLEAELFARVVEGVGVEATKLRELAGKLADVDAIGSFAEVAERRGYCRPRMLDAGAEILLEDSRHPVVEATTREDFVPNDALFDDEQQVVVLTGPNMGGKSTYLRQVALIVLMAHAGSFVPASRAEIGLVDRIFTRVGASDDLARGESTFMVEMIETANILRYATDRSLVVLDEVGRGTATFDGLSLAWAIVEHLHEEVGAKTLFATHYHELTELASLLPRVTNRTMTVREWEEKIVFLHRVEPGSADKSYGIQVARLAGLPEAVTARAGEVLSNLESAEYDPGGKPRLARGESAPETGDSQMALFARKEDVVAELLREVDLDRMTPLAALNFLSAVKERLG
ncbi:MAG: DNA mismatch repair protein MutS, partial [Acidobacteriota bacterium]